MRQLVVLSGKGGTGKTTVAGALVDLIGCKACADCDVDAPNLHILHPLGADAVVTDSYGLPKARIDPEKCIGCGRCMDACRFDAISEAGGAYEVGGGCEGCAVCTLVCGSDAIEMVPAVSGRLLLRKGGMVLSSAELAAGAGATGKLVSQVKEQLKANSDWDGVAVVDGSPGIGCPVIATLAGADYCLMVAEPSVSGISDLERVIEVAKGFRIPVAVCVNKYDLNLKRTEEIERLCAERGAMAVGRIPYDPAVPEAVNACTPVTRLDCPAADAIRSVHAELGRMIGGA